MTPEQYHLNEGPRLREKIAHDQAAAQAKETEEDRARIVAAAKKHGIVLPKSAKPGNNPEEWRVGDLRVEINGVVERRSRYQRGTSDRQSDRLYRRRRALCDNLNVAGAKRFAAFVKTKYGKDANDATITRAHVEWLDLLSNCTC